jgi:hypothetical protein
LGWKEIQASDHAPIRPSGFIKFIGILDDTLVDNYAVDIASGSRIGNASLGEMVVREVEEEEGVVPLRLEHCPEFLLQNVHASTLIVFDAGSACRRCLWTCCDADVVSLEGGCR